MNVLQIVLFVLMALWFVVGTVVVIRLEMWLLGATFKQFRTDPTLAEKAFFCKHGALIPFWIMAWPLSRRIAQDLRRDLERARNEVR